MTTGSTGGLTNGPSTYMTWQGSDGKTELFQGVERPKWNSFRKDIQRRILHRPSIYNVYYSHSSDTGSSWTADDTLKLQEKLISAIRAHDFDLGVAVAQGKLTVDLVTSNLRKLWMAFRYIKRGDPSSAARMLGASPPRRGYPPPLGGSDLAGRWLEMQYGWLPLLSDCFNAAEAFASVADPPRKKILRVSRTKTSTGTDLTPFPSPVFKRESRSIQYEAYEALSAQRSLGLYDPLSIAWELVPYSFVVDWFVPIGTYLDNLNVLPNCEGRFLSSKIRRELTFCTSNGFWVYEGAQTIYEHIEIERAVSSSLSVPLPSFRAIPEAMSSRRVWNAIALAYQRFS